MDICYADDYCATFAFEVKNLEISETNPSINEDENDQFFIKFEVETITSPAVESKKRFTFWTKCPRFKEGNLSRERISMMLSRVGVARHKQGFMIDIISLHADQIANAVRYKADTLLPMFVSICIFACSCDEEVEAVS